MCVYVCVYVMYVCMCVNVCMCIMASGAIGIIKGTDSVLK